MRRWERYTKNGGIMAIRKYLIGLSLTILIVATLIGPAAAATGYSVTVSSYGSGPSSSQLSPSKLAVLNDYSTSKGSVSAFSLFGGEKSSALLSGEIPSFGSVSAYSQIKSMQQTKNGSVAMDFSQSVSMSGDIYTFEYIFSFS